MNKYVQRWLRINNGLLHQRIKPGARLLESALLDQFVPDGGGVLIRRCDRHDARRLAAGKRAAAYLGFFIQPSELKTFSKSLHGPFLYLFIQGV